jgi:hypothetical protein
MHVDITDALSEKSVPKNEREHLLVRDMSGSSQSPQFSQRQIAIPDMSQRNLTNDKVMASDLTIFQKPQERFVWRMKVVNPDGCVGQNHS